jgi:hypothetical protein
MVEWLDGWIVKKTHTSFPLSTPTPTVKPTPSSGAGLKNQKNLRDWDFKHTFKDIKCGTVDLSAFEESDIVNCLVNIWPIV